MLIGGGAGGWAMEVEEEEAAFEAFRLNCHRCKSLVSAQCEGVVYVVPSLFIALLLFTLRCCYSLFPQSFLRPVYLIASLRPGREPHMHGHLVVALRVRQRPPNDAEYFHVAARQCGNREKQLSVGLLRDVSPFLGLYRGSLAVLDPEPRSRYI